MNSCPTIPRIAAVDAVALALRHLGHAMRTMELIRAEASHTTAEVEALGWPKEAVDVEDLGIIGAHVEAAISELMDWKATIGTPSPAKVA